MQSWYTILPKNPWISVYVWVIFCIMPFYFIIRSLSLLEIIIGIVFILLFFLSHYFSFNSKSALLYMWISFEMVLNIAMTLMYGYVYLSLFTAFFIGNFRNTVGFFIMYGLHIGFTILSIVAGYFLDLDLFLSQTPFIIVTVVGVVLLPFTLYSKNKREKLQGQLETANERIAELIIHEERQRIARDLHDTLGQKLSMIGLKSDLASRLVEKNPQEAIREIKDIRHTASIALKEVRELVSDMRAVKLPEEIARVKQILKAAEIDYEIKGEKVELHLPVLVESVLSMSLKEAITNVVKHSEAKKCKIIIEKNDNEIFLTVYDNGKGFNEKLNIAGNGLKGMRERLEFINGSVQIESKNGTKLLISVPLAITHQKGSV
ncbi:sensor histidine kinase [Ureibacillus chungkukjangi]|uniref:histidine kinase n=1 Tax=Ureibacillus chungkukjangi TaxID=1202712 RepID=A0A318THK5_9BACL|nr:sensor histidine kinase [Ureibacillus chungkukjangi]MCM3389484.1 sensor histidine kinase [Ureibacillus chungkukjangi]PYF04331.1 two-component system sensor histidine kinase DesK [Ureibacillus chungkukjangi]